MLTAVVRALRAGLFASYVVLQRKVMIDGVRRRVMAAATQRNRRVRWWQGRRQRASWSGSYHYYCYCGGC